MAFALGSTDVYSTKLTSLSSSFCRTSKYQAIVSVYMHRLGEKKGEGGGRTSSLPCKAVGAEREGGGREGRVGRALSARFVFSSTIDNLESQDDAPMQKVKTFSRLSGPKSSAKLRYVNSSSTVNHSHRSALPLPLPLLPCRWVPSIRSESSSNSTSDPDESASEGGGEDVCNGVRWAEEDEEEEVGALSEEGEGRGRGRAAK